MSTAPIGAAVGVPPLSRWRRRGPVIAAVVIVVLAVGAFFLWGPIGLGNGPVNAGIGGVDGASDLAAGPMAFFIPVRNTGDAPAVIDGVELISGTRYPGPRVLALKVGTWQQCGGAWATHRTARGWAPPSVCGADTGPLIGHAVDPNRGGLPAAAVAAAPHPGTCWVITKIVVHYHVGIRYYSATDPYQLAVCSDDALVNSAMDAMAAVSE